MNQFSPVHERKEDSPLAAGLRDLVDGIATSGAQVEERIELNARGIALEAELHEGEATILRISRKVRLEN